MGINTQPYLKSFFENLRAQSGYTGQKVEPVAPIPKVAQYERKYSPDVVVNLSKEAFKEINECGK